MIDDAALRPVLVLLALLPAAVMAAYVLAQTRCTTTAELLGVAFGLGACSCLLLGGVTAYAGSIEGIEPLYLRAVLDAFLTAAIPEETAKFLILLLILMRHEDCERPADVLVAAVFSGLGFAAFENMFYVTHTSTWQSTAIYRGLAAVPGHAIYGMVMGYCALRARRSPERRRRLLGLGLGAAILLHGLYNTPLMIAAGWEEAAARPEPMAITLNAVFFGAVLCIGGALGVWSTTKGAQQARHADAHMPGRLNAPMTRILLSGQIWMLSGPVLLVAGGLVGPIFVAREANSVIATVTHAPIAILPIIFGISMFRLGLRLRADGAV